VAILFETMNIIKYNIKSMSSRVALHTCRTKTCNPEVVDGHLLNHCYVMVEHCYSYYILPGMQLNKKNSR